MKYNDELVDQDPVEKYIFIIRNRLMDILEKREYIGNIIFEVNIKHGGITNMNIIPREFVKI